MQHCWCHSENTSTIFPTVKRQTTIYELIDHNSKRPRVTFRVIRLSLKNLRCHCIWSSTISFHNSVSLSFSHSKVSDFKVVFVINKNIGKFQVAMCDSFLMKLNQRFNNTWGNIFAEWLRKSALLLEKVVKIAFSTVLKHNIPLVFLLEISNKVNNILNVFLLNISEYLNFPHNCFFFPK